MSKIVPSAFLLIAKKQLVGWDDKREIELYVYCHFDAAKRGLCTGAGCNFLTTHLIIASYLAARLQSKAFHDQVTQAYAALEKAAGRDTATLDLTSTEYRLLRAAFISYFRALPYIEVGIMADACAAAAKMMNQPQGEQQ